MNIKDYFERICYKGSQEKIDLETLTEVFQHHIRAVPFENLSLHCGETVQLDLESVYDKIVKHNRGGWCMENNHLLFWAFQTMGYEVGLLGARVYEPERKAYNQDVTHVLIKVRTKSEQSFTLKVKPTLWMVVLEWLIRCGNRWS